MCVTGGRRCPGSSGGSTSRAATTARKRVSRARAALKAAKRDGDPDAIGTAQQALTEAQTHAQSVKAAHRNETAPHEGDVTSIVSAKDNTPDNPNQDDDPRAALEKLRAWRAEYERDLQTRRQARGASRTQSEQDTNKNAGHEGDVTPDAEGAPTGTGFVNTNIAYGNARVGSQRDVRFGSTPLTQEHVNDVIKAAQSRVQQAQQQVSDAVSRAARDGHGPTINVASGNDRIAQQNGINFGDTHHH